jgi:hypothetical protein
LILRNNIKYFSQYEEFMDWIVTSYEEVDNSNLNIPICVPNIPKEDELKIRVDYINEYLTNIYKTKPKLVKEFQDVLEKLNTKYDEKIQILFEVTKEIIPNIVK